MAADGDRPVRSLNYEQFVDAPDVLPSIDHPPIVFNTAGGPIRLLRAEPGAMCVPTLDDVMAHWRFCADRGWPSPHTLVVSGTTYDYLAGLLNGTIAFPQRKG